MSRGIETLRYSVHFFGPEDEWDVWCVEPEVQVACFSATYCPDAECHAKELCFKLNTSQKGQGDAPPETGWLIEDEYGKSRVSVETLRKHQYREQIGIGECTGCDWRVVHAPVGPVRDGYEAYLAHVAAVESQAPQKGQGDAPGADYEYDPISRVTEK